MVAVGNSRASTTQLPLNRRVPVSIFVMILFASFLFFSVFITAAFRVKTGLDARYHLPVKKSLSCKLSTFTAYNSHSLARIIIHE